MHRRAGVIDTFFGNKVEKLLRSTNKMILINRTFIPLNTVTPHRGVGSRTRSVRDGFSRWVRGLARLTRQLGCRIIFCCNADVQPQIRGVIYRENYGIRCEFRTVEDWDDFILLGNRVLDDDLFVLIGARANSVSYSAEMVELPSFLQKYFSRNNLMVIYPEQFGAEVALTSFTDPLSSDISSTASPLWMRLRSRWRKLVNAKRRFTHRNRKPKY